MKQEKYILKVNSKEVKNNIMVFGDKTPFDSRDEILYMHRKEISPKESPKKKKPKRIQEIRNEDIINKIESEEEPQWILENEDGTFSFNGRHDGCQKARYVLFVPKDNLFEVIPVCQWYKFNQKPFYTTQELQNSDASFVKEENNSTEELNDEIDYEEVFDDDDENNYKREDRVVQSKLTKEGKEIEALLKNKDEDERSFNFIIQKEDLNNKKEITKEEIIFFLDKKTHRMDSFILPFKERIKTEEKKKMFREILKEVADFFESDGVIHIKAKE